MAVILKLMIHRFLEVQEHNKVVFLFWLKLDILRHT